jgi:hypothetical protein
VCERCGSIRVERLRSSPLDKIIALLTRRYPVVCRRCGWRAWRRWSRAGSTEKLVQPQSSSVNPLAIEIPGISTDASDDLNLKDLDQSVILTDGPPAHPIERVAFGAPPREPRHRKGKPTSTNSRRRILGLLVISMLSVFLVMVGILAS